MVDFFIVQIIGFPVVLEKSKIYSLKSLQSEALEEFAVMSQTWSATHVSSHYFEPSIHEMVQT